MLVEAARIMDPIEHTDGWLAGLVGALIGLAVGLAIAALVIFLAPVAIVAALGGALLLSLSIGLASFSLGKELGDRFLKKFFTPEASHAGDIAQGSPNTTVGSRAKLAARVTDQVGCHRGKVIATGVKFITINKLPPSRKDEKTQCKGKITAGCPTVKYGGDSTEFPELVKMDAEESPPTWLYFLYEGVDIASLVVSIISLRGFFKPGAFAGATRFIRGYKIFDAAHSGFDVAAGQVMAGMEGKYAELYGRITDNYQYSAAQQGLDVTRTDTYKDIKFGYQVFNFGKSLFGIRMSFADNAPPAAAPASPSPAADVPTTVRMDAPAAAPPDVPRTIRIEDPPAAPASLPSTTRVGDPPGWSDTVKAINAERRGEVPLPDWHERMAGSRGD